jgi:hypothetical protein
MKSATTLAPALLFGHDDPVFATWSILLFGRGSGAGTALPLGELIIF